MAWCRQERGKGDLLHDDAQPNALIPNALIPNALIPNALNDQMP